MPRTRVDLCDRTGNGTSGAPRIPSRSWSSASRPTGHGGDGSACGRIHAFTLMQSVLLLLELSPERNISSGRGTSRTVSSPSSRSRFGHSFLMEVPLLSRFLSTRWCGQ
ncbi:unnamed protein product [Musa banksii]